MYKLLPLLVFFIDINLFWASFSDICVKVFKNGPSKICGRHALKNLKWFGLLPKYKIFNIFESNKLK